MAKKETPGASGPPQQPPNAYAQHPPNCYYVPGTPVGLNFVNPAKDSDYFNPGSLVECFTCHKTKIVGTVMSFEPSTKMLFLKCKSSKGAKYNDAQMVNLNLVSDVKVLKEATETNEDVPTMDIPRIKARIQTSLTKKRQMNKAFKSGITPEGQKVFQAIGKTIDDIDWNESNIVIMGKVTISPPYLPENVKGIPDSKAFQHIRKIVEKHYDDQRRSGSEVTPSGSPEKTLPATKAEAPKSSATPPPASSSSSPSSQPSGRSNGPNTQSSNSSSSNSATSRSGGKGNNSRSTNGDSSAVTSSRKSIPKPIYQWGHFRHI